jgi:hypothetical protein
LKGFRQNGIAEFEKIEMINQVFETRLTYKKEFDKHNINATAVGEFSDNLKTIFTGGATGFSNQTGGFNNLSSATIATLPKNNIAKDNLMSFLGRVAYSYNNKYLLTASIRADGSSKFGKENKWGYFPSVALGWTLSEESIIKNMNIFDNLKLRASYGVTGNNQIPAYSSIGLLGAANYVFNDVFYSGIAQNNVSNPGLKWETTAQSNFGIDLGFLKNRLNITAEVYYKKTTDLLLDVQLPLSSGYETALKNIGSFSNKGFELTVNSVNIDKNDFLEKAILFSTNLNTIFSRNFLFLTITFLSIQIQYF